MKPDASNVTNVAQTLHVKSVQGFRLSCNVCQGNQTIVFVVYKELEITKQSVHLFTFRLVGIKSIHDTIIIRCGGEQTCTF